MIYLDNAATSFPKPKRVIAEESLCLKKYCGNPGRGSHKISMRAMEKVFECREEIASFFHSESPENVVFTLNTTMALNTVIKGLLSPGDHVLISDLEHNAVFRPIDRLAREGNVSYDVFPSFADDPARSPEKISRELQKLIRPNTRMVVCTHASNICSITMPIAKIGEICRQNGILFVVDAAQSAGHLDISMEEMQIDALCAPGHKGLLGAGCGFFLLGDHILPKTLLEGGSGVNSLDPQMPDEPPERYEAGTLPLPAIAGLCEGIREVNRFGLDEIRLHESLITSALQDRLSDLPGVRIYTPFAHGGVLLFSCDRFPAERVGEELDRRGICVRSGYHCAPLAHKTLSTPQGGAVRVSPGIYNKISDADALWKGVREILWA